MGLLATAAIVAASALAMLLTGDIASIATGRLITVLSLWFTAAGRHAAPVEVST